MVKILMVKIAVTEYGCGSLFFMLFSAIDFSLA